MAVCYCINESLTYFYTTRPRVADGAYRTRKTLKAVM